MQAGTRRANTPCLVTWARVRMGKSPATRHEGQLCFPIWPKFVRRLTIRPLPLRGARPCFRTLRTSQSERSSRIGCDLTKVKLDNIAPRRSTRRTSAVLRPLAGRCATSSFSMTPDSPLASQSGVPRIPAHSQVPAALWIISSNISGPNTSVRRDQNIYM